MNGFKTPVNGFCLCEYCGLLVPTGYLWLSKHREVCKPRRFVYPLDPHNLKGHFKDISTAPGIEVKPKVRDNYGNQ